MRCCTPEVPHLPLHKPQGDQTDTSQSRGVSVRGDIIFTFTFIWIGIWIELLLSSIRVSYESLMQSSAVVFDSCELLCEFPFVEFSGRKKH